MLMSKWVILQEILLLDHITQNTWDGGYSSHHEDDFSFLDNTNNNQVQDVGSFRFMGDDQNVRSIEVISGADEQLRMDRMVENLRWVGISNKDLEMTYWDDYKTVSVENMPRF